MEISWNTLSFFLQVAHLFSNIQEQGTPNWGEPICAPQWEQRGVHYLKEIYNDFGLLSFADVKDAFDLPGSTFFFYLQLRSALRAHGVPFQYPLPTHPLRDLFTKQNGTKGMVSKLYHFLQVTDLVSLPVERVWRRDGPDRAQDFDWDAMWSSIHEASHNPDHQQIHFNFLHRTNLTPVKLHHMKIISEPCCNLCSLKAQSSFIHMFWDCPPVLGQCCIQIIWFDRWYSTCNYSCVDSKWSVNPQYF